MKSLKTVLLSTAVLAGLGVFLGGQDAFASTILSTASEVPK